MRRPPSASRPVTRVGRRRPRVVLEACEPRRLLATFAVTTASDAGAGSLRDAINQANLTAGADVITFAIGSGAVTISPAAALPAVTDAVTIDATTQPGYAGTPLVTLDGGNNLQANGLTISGAGSVVRGLAIQRFARNGIAISGTGNAIEASAITSNGIDGIEITASNNRVGGTSAAQRNLISGNVAAGVEISGLLVSGNVVSGNYIGTDAAGTAAVANGLYGVHVVNAINNTIGGTAGGAGNLISGNRIDGVRITGDEASGNRVQGNRIGTNAAGDAAVGNGQFGVFGTGGVRIVNGRGNVIGGDIAGAGNLISGNYAEGIYIEGSRAKDTVIQGNWIGLNAAGNEALPNQNDGIQITQGEHRIGGSTPLARNVVAGNYDDGIEIRNVNASKSVITGNYIGLSADGLLPIGNLSDGIELEGAEETRIGGPLPGERNVIAANASDGIEGNMDAQGNGYGTRVLNNWIGVNAAGAAAGNGGHGVHMKCGGDTTIGGSPANANLIAHNGLDGVFIVTSNGNRVTHNSIRDNGDMGIDLIDHGVNPNDPGDLDDGPNGLQNFPLIGYADAGGTVTVTLDSLPNRTYAIDVYCNADVDSTGHGEGARWLGRGTLVTGADGMATATFWVNMAGVSDTMITATATDFVGSTSEFSPVAYLQPDTRAPEVRAATFAFDPAPAAAAPLPPHALRFEFSENVSASLAAGDVELVNLTTGQAIPASSLTVAYDAATNVATLSLIGNGVLPDGNYRATLAAGAVADAAGNVTSAATTVEFFVLAGDANRDRRVDIGDFAIVAGRFNQAGTFTQGDFNYDGAVNIGDFSILASKFNTSLPVAAAGSGSAAAVLGPTPTRLFSTNSVVPDGEDVLEGTQPA